MALEEFRALINSEDEWQLAFNDIIKENGWKELDGMEICQDGNRKLVFNVSMVAVIHELS